MNKTHKEGCMANVRCLVNHIDGVCGGPYGVCTCFSSEEVQKKSAMDEEMDKLRYEILTQPAQKEGESWEVRFEEAMPLMQETTHVDPRYLNEEKVKHFIRGLLSTAKQEERERIKKVVEGVQTDYKTKKRETPFQDTLSNHAVNVLSDIISKLEE